MCLSMYYLMIKDIIYYGCYFHSHIGANKLLRKIVFTDMAICVMPERNITGLAICAQKNWDVQRTPVNLIGLVQEKNIVSGLSDYPVTISY